MRNTLVIRFGALGDLCVLAWALAQAHDNRTEPADRVTVVTKARFAPLMAHMRGIDDVIGLTDGSLGSLRRLAADLRRRSWHGILDAHNTLRSRLLLGLMGRRADTTLAKDTAARLAFLAFGRPHRRLDQSMRDRFDRLAVPIAPMAQAPAAPAPPLIHLRQDAPAGAAPILGLAPGAQWDTKRWPAEHFADLVRRYRRGGGGPVRIFLGPREAVWYPDSELSRIAARDKDVTPVQLPDLAAVAGSLAALAVLVTNDSGLLHLAETVGTPVLAFFGPTVREFGYFPLLRSSRVLERAEDCRPCSRNGKRPCHRRDLACLARITPASAMAALQTMLAEAVR